MTDPLHSEISRLFVKGYLEAMNREIGITDEVTESEIIGFIEAVKREDVIRRDPDQGHPRG